MSRRVQKTVETEIREVGMAETGEERKERRKQEEKTEERKDDRHKESSRGMGNLG